jgi:hypothetical protein
LQQAQQFVDTRLALWLLEPPYKKYVGRCTHCADAAFAHHCRTRPAATSRYAVQRRLASPGRCIRDRPLPTPRAPRIALQSARFSVPHKDSRRAACYAQPPISLCNPATSRIMPWRPHQARPSLAPPQPPRFLAAPLHACRRRQTSQKPAPVPPGCRTAACAAPRAPRGTSSPTVRP